MRNENKFLVTWVEDNGFTRGQATKTRAEADKLFDFVTVINAPPAQYAEIRRIGSVVKHFQGPVQ